MRAITALRQLGPSYYRLCQIAEEFALPLPSARVFCTRKVKAGELIRIRRDLYVLAEDYPRFSEKQLFSLSNVIQTPSYISYTTALSYDGQTTQLQPSLIEAANPVRSRVDRAAPFEFRYYYCRPPYYFGFQKREGFFIAEPEKALLDCLYLMALGRYRLDVSALTLKGLQWVLMEKWLQKYPKRIRVFYKEWRDRYESPRTT